MFDLLACVWSAYVICVRERTRCILAHLLKLRALTLPRPLEPVLLVMPKQTIDVLQTDFLHATCWTVVGDALAVE